MYIDCCIISVYNGVVRENIDDTETVYQKHTFNENEV